jgi:hypothetical protein
MYSIVYKKKASPYTFCKILSLVNVVVSTFMLRAFRTFPPYNKSKTWKYECTKWPANYKSKTARLQQKKTDV